MSLLVRILLTYLVHSSLLLGAAAVVCAALRARRLALQEALLRAALLGGLVTTALQVGLAFEPIAGRLRLADPLLAEATPASIALTLPGSTAPALPPAPPATAAPSAAAPSASAAGWETRAILEPSLVERLARAAADTTLAAETVVAGGSRRTAGAWRTLLVLGWAAVALVGVVRLVVASARLRRLLRGRSRLGADTLCEAASALAVRLGIRRSVRLSAVPRLEVPLATGLLRPEVCLPTRALAEMDRDQQLALCAHELAHVARRDPAWILLVRGVETLAPLQPLNTWARRRLQDLAECLSDDLAVSTSVRPLGLARSLVDVASWTIGDSTLLPVTAAGAFARRSRLGHRVERLMDPVRTPERQNRLFLPIAALAVVASALVTPVVSGDGSRPTPAPPDPPLAHEVAPPPEAPEVPEAPEAEPAALEVAPLPPAPKPAERPVPAPRPAPRPHPAPHPAPHAQGDADASALAALSSRIEARARQHEAELSRLQAEMEALAARFAPDEAELSRLGDEIGRAAEDLAQAALDGVAGEKSDRAQAAARHLAELEAKLQGLTSQIRVPNEQIQALAEKARALAEASRPSEDELRELRRLSRELAREATPNPEDMALIRKEAREQAHIAAVQAREAMRHAEEELRRAREEMRQVHEQARRAREEARRAREQEQARQKAEADRAAREKKERQDQERKTERQ